MGMCGRCLCSGACWGPFTQGPLRVPADSPGISAGSRVRFTDSSTFLTQRSSKPLNFSFTSRVVWRLNLRAPPPSAGNNAVEMLTTAHYDAGTDEFIIHTPNALAQASPALRCAVLCHNMQVLA